MPECHSTNTYAQELCQHSPSTPEGTVVITANQTAGRGQRGNSWFVEPGKNFTFSMILKPTFLPVKDQFYLNIFTSLSVYDYLQSKNCRTISIKWPNDINVNGRKICGILIENLISGDRFSNVIVGIGLNVNQRQFDHGTATSLSLELEQDFELTKELEVLLSFFEARFLMLRRNNLDALLNNYLQVMYWRDEIHHFTSNGEDFEGMIVGLDQSGRLEVKIGDKLRLFGLKEISYVR